MTLLPIPENFSIQEILATDPRTWKEAGIDKQLVLYYRSKRDSFGKAKKAEAAGGPKVRTKNPTRKAAIEELLAQIDLDI